ncbi:hypothetical protein [Azospirillum palustre]|uniref:hypothetical protein n=1 Tax=Azospirillum palustre TaxID=2044885 RepID=UPI001177BF72|nr:hypothetical protein [Azospirillum palustre]
MGTSFEIPTVGRGWSILLGDSEAWFCRGMSGNLLGPYPTPFEAAGALIHDHELWLNQQLHGNEADAFSRLLPDNFYAAGFSEGMTDPADDLQCWRVPLRSFSRNFPKEMFLLTNEGTVTPDRYRTLEEVTAALSYIRNEMSPI